MDFGEVVLLVTIGPMHTQYAGGQRILILSSHVGILAYAGSQREILALGDLAPF